MHRILLFLGAFLMVLAPVSAQELDCRVTVNASQIEGSEQTQFRAMETAIREFLNGRRWTSDVYKTEERIECSILITLSERISSSDYKGNIQIQARRPVFNSNYYTTIFNHRDNDLQFRYLQFDVLDFSESNHLSNLTSVLGFYVYMILGTDYDTFSRKGGEVWFNKAQAVVNNAQSAAEPGWKAFEGTDNRFHLVQNLLDPRFQGLRDCMYEYHRLGFDLCFERVEEGRANMTTALEKLRQVHRALPNSLNLRLFFTAKVDEIVSVYKGATTEEKTRVIALLDQIDPARSGRYAEIRSQ